MSPNSSKQDRPGVTRAVTAAADPRRRRWRKRLFVCVLLLLLAVGWTAFDRTRPVSLSDLDVVMTREQGQIVTLVIIDDHIETWDWGRWFSGFTFQNLRNGAPPGLKPDRVRKRLALQNRDLSCLTLPEMKSLRRLVVSSYYPGEITDAGLLHLSGLTNLESLELRGIKNLTDAGLTHLSGLTNLESLELHFLDNLTDAGLAHLSGLTSLKSLKLDDIDNLTGAGLAHLSGLTSLKSLELHATKIMGARRIKNLTDAGLAHLSGLTNLESLELHGINNLTDAGLAHLSGLTSLESLELYRCDNLTGAGVDKLRDSLPEVKILERKRTRR